VPFDELLNLVPSHWHSDDRWRSLTYASVLVIANVTELATGKTLSGNATVRCHSENYKLDFLDMTPKSYKSGLDFRGYVSKFYSVYFMFILIFLIMVIIVLIIDA